VPLDRSPKATIHVVDDSDTPIAGAELFKEGLGNDAPDSLGLTNDQGIVSLVRFSAVPITIRTVCPGYVTEETDLEHIENGQYITIKLQYSMSVFGKVVLPSGEGVANAMVLLWPKDVFPAQDLAARALRGNDASALLSRTEIDGLFEAPGAKPGRSYWAVAAGNGVATSSATLLHAGGGTAELRVGYLYGCRVRVVAPAGSDLTSLAAPLLNPVQVREVPATYVTAPNFVAALTGLAAKMDYGAVDQYEYLFVSEVDSEYVGESRFSLTVPGFQPIEETIAFGRVKDRISERVFVLTPGRQQLARCTFRLHAPSGIALEKVQAIGDVARIKVTPQSALTENGDLLSYFQLRVKSFKEASVNVDLPLGTYEARLDVLATSVSVPDRHEPPVQFSVVQGGAFVDFDLAGCGGISVVLRTPGGEKAGGALTLVLIEGAVEAGDLSVASSVLLSKGPYLVAPVRPGSFTIIVKGHAFLVPRHQMSHTLVESGVWTQLVLQSR
jgi:hypothetical protein